MSPVLSVKALVAAVVLSLSGSVLAVPRYHESFKVDQLTASSTASADLINPTSFPALTDDSLIPLLETLAQGTLPNSAPPPPGAISAEGITNLQLIMLNEFFEASFFTSLLYNITNQIDGFVIYNQDTQILVEDALIAVIAQEQLHGIGAAKNLASQNATLIKPCTYKFPTSNFRDAIAFASLFTEVVLGTLQDVQQIFAENKDFGPVRLVGSVIGQEGQQDGFYRLLQNIGHIPSVLPFLTTSTRDFAFSILEQNVLVSCPNDSVLKAKLKLFGVLNLLTPPQPTPIDQCLQFSFDLNSLRQSSNVLTPSAPYATGYTAYGKTWSTSVNATNWSQQASLVYINQQNLPVVESLDAVSVSGTTVTFNATFPFATNLMNGLTLAVVVNGTGPFLTADAVAASALFGPVPFVLN